MQGPSKGLSLVVIALAIIPAAMAMTFSFRANAAQITAYKVVLAQQEGTGAGMWGTVDDATERATVKEYQTAAAKKAIRELGVNVFPGSLFYMATIGAALVAVYRTRSFIWGALVGLVCMGLASIHVLLLHRGLMDILVAMEKTGIWGAVTENVSIPMATGLGIGLVATAFSAGLGGFLGSTFSNLSDSAGWDQKAPEQDFATSIYPTAAEMGIEDSDPPAPSPPAAAEEPSPEPQYPPSVADQLPPPVAAQPEPLPATPEAPQAAEPQAPAPVERVTKSCPSCGAGNAPVNATCIVCGMSLATAH